jgi:hypothetical protein
MPSHIDDIDWEVWYTSLHPDEPVDVVESWSHPAAMVFERQKFRDAPIGQFYARSLSLPWRMLRDEGAQESYYRALCNELSLRIPRGAAVAVVGPTSGRDLVAIHDAGGYPVLLCDGRSHWSDLVECRMMELGIPFRTVDPRDLIDEGSAPIHYTIGNAWDPDPSNTVRLVGKISGKYGYLLVSRTNLMSISSATSDGLYRVSIHNPEVAMFFRMSLST